MNHHDRELLQISLIEKMAAMAAIFLSGERPGE